MFGLFKKDKLPKSLKRALEPRRGFVVKTRVLFLSECENKFDVTAPNPAGRFSLVLRVALAAAGLFAVVHGVAVYADASNVGPNSPLYSLKKYNEFVQLAFAKTADKPQLHIKFAKRRLAEIEETKKTPVFASSTVSAAQEDLGKNMSASLDDVDDKNYPEQELPKFCSSFGDLAGASSSDVENIMVKHPDIAEKFQSKCAQILENKNGTSTSDNELNVNNQSSTRAGSRGNDLNKPDNKDNHAGDSDPKAGGDAGGGQNGQHQENDD